MSNIYNTQENQPLNFIFAPVPRWLLLRKDVSDGAKLIYARLIQFSGMGKNDVYPSRQTLGDEVGKSVRAIDRFIKELINHNLILVIRHGKSMNNSYQFLTHIWMKESKTYDSPKVATSDSPKVATPSKDKDISLKYNIINNKNNNLSNEIPLQNDNIREKFEEFWTAYPKKMDKKSAYEAFCAALKKIEFEKLMKRVRAYSRWRYKDNHDQFTMMPHNWLNGHRWEDYYGIHEIEPKPILQTSSKPTTAPVPSVKISQQERELMAEKLKSLRRELRAA